MKRHLIVLVLAVLVAGCTVLDDGGGEQERPKTVEISGPDCTIAGEDCSSTEVTKFGGPARVEVQIDNYGDERMTIDIGSDGRDVMVSKCNDEIVNISSFTGRVEGPSRFDRYDSDDAFPERVELGADERLVAVWQLDIIPDDSNVSRLGYSCPMDFELSFDQIINSSQQIQIKADEDVPDASSLESRTTAERPVRLVIDAPTSFVPITGRSLIVRSFLRNVGRGDVTDIDRIEQHGDGVLAAANCRPPNEELRMYGGGQRSGESYRKTCTVQDTDIDTPAQSDVKWARFTTKYTYSMPLGAATISIAPVEGS